MFNFDDAVQYIRKYEFEFVLYLPVQNLFNLIPWFSDYNEHFHLAV